MAGKAAERNEPGMSPFFRRNGRRLAELRLKGFEAALEIVKLAA